MSLEEAETFVQLAKKRKKKRPGKKLFASNCRKKRIVRSWINCCICGKEADNELGTFFQNEDAKLAAHQFCLLFSCGLPQSGTDDVGFEGFLFEDIRKEVRRSARIKCKYCTQAGASSGCYIKNCHTTYHYKCGLEQKVQFDFQGTFNTYCPKHRKFQDMRYILNGSCRPTCPICMEIISEPEASILKMPCCKNVFAHKICIQQQAVASGYFFKCPICKNENLFRREMAMFGIYIPQRDASWEDNNAFSELLEQHNSCDLPFCKCPMGKNYKEESGKWELLRCCHCGQSAVHRHCFGKSEYVCHDCKEPSNSIENNIKPCYVILTRLSNSLISRYTGSETGTTSETEEEFNYDSDEMEDYDDTLEARELEFIYFGNNTDCESDANDADFEL